MEASGLWQSFLPTYRKKEVGLIVNWVLAGVSGALIGPAGAGKSNFLGFLCHRPDCVAAYFPAGVKPASFIPIDLNILPDEKTSTFYRVILRSIYENPQQIPASLHDLATTLYRESRPIRDPFLTQSALRELLHAFQREQQRLVFVLDHFDRFCEAPRPVITDSLRGLRDSFKETLVFIVGMRQEIHYLPEPSALGELYELLDTHICWLGPMTADEARQAIRRHISQPTNKISDETIAQLIVLSGGYPSLLTAICHWWLRQSDLSMAGLLADKGVQYRLDEIWLNLTQEEQLALSRLQRGLPAGEIIQRLLERGLCQSRNGTWVIFSPLFHQYITTLDSKGRGKIWFNDQAVYQGDILLKGLTQVELAVLTFLARHPHQKHTKTDLIFNAWPKELNERGVTDDSLYQVIHQLRQVIEPDPARPCYILNWRGRPEGGYQFFPEGKPK